MYPPFLRRVLREGAKPPGVPLPPGFLLDYGWFGGAGTATAATASGGAAKGWKPIDRSPHGRRSGMNNSKPPQSRGLTAIDGAMVLIIVLLIVQIWLLSAT